MEPNREMPAFHPDILPNYRTKDEFFEELAKIEKRVPFTHLEIKNDKVTRRIINPFRALYDRYQEIRGKKFRHSDSYLVYANLKKINKVAEREGWFEASKLTKDQLEIKDRFLERLGQCKEHWEQPLPETPLQKHQILAIRSNLPLLKELKTIFKSRDKYKTTPTDSPSVKKAAAQREKAIIQLEEIVKAPYAPENQKKLREVEQEARNQIENLNFHKKNLDGMWESSDQTIDQLINVHEAIVELAITYQEILEYKSSLALLKEKKAENLKDSKVEDVKELRAFIREKEAAIRRYAQSIARPQSENSVLEPAKDRLHLNGKFKPHDIIQKNLRSLGFHPFQAKFLAEKVLKGEGNGFQSIADATSQKKYLASKLDCISALSNGIPKIDLDGLVEVFTEQQFNDLANLSFLEKQAIIDELMVHPEKGLQTIVSEKIQHLQKSQSVERTESIRQALSRALEEKTEFPKIDSELDSIAGQTDQLIETLKEIAQDPNNPQNPQKLKAIQKNGTEIEKLLMAYADGRGGLNGKGLEIDKVKQGWTQLLVASRAATSWALAYEQINFYQNTYQLFEDYIENPDLKPFKMYIEAQQLVADSLARQIAQPQRFFDEGVPTIRFDEYKNVVIEFKKPDRHQEPHQQFSTLMAIMTTQNTLGKLDEYYHPRKIVASLLKEGEFTEEKVTYLIAQIFSSFQTTQEVDWNKLFEKLLDALENGQTSLTSQDCRQAIFLQLEGAYATWKRQIERKEPPEIAPSFEEMLKGFPSIADLLLSEWQRLASVNIYLYINGMKQHRDGASWLDILSDNEAK